MHRRVRTRNRYAPAGHHRWRSQPIEICCRGAGAGGSSAPRRRTDPSPASSTSPSGSRSVIRSRSTRHRRDADVADQRQRHVRRAAVHHDPGCLGRGRGGDDIAQRRRRSSHVDRAQRAEAALGRHPSGQHRRQRRLVELQQNAGVRQPAPYVGDVLGHAFGERGGQVPYRTWIAQHPAADRQVDGCREGPRAGHLQLHQAVEVGCVLGQRVEVAVPEVASTPQIPARVRGHPPLRRVQIHRDLDQQPGGTADHVSARAPCGKLRQVRQSAVHRRSILTASAMSVPGSDPMPVAEPGAHGKVTRRRPARGWRRS